MTLILRLVPVALLWAAVLARARTLRRGPVDRALWLTLFSCAIAATLNLPAVAPAVDRVTGAGSNLAHLVKYVTVLAAAAAAREVVRGFALSPEFAGQGARRRLEALGFAVFSLCVLFAVAPVHGEEATGLTERYATNPIMIAYWLVFLVFLAVALGSIGKLTWWYLHNTPPSTLRAAMIWIELGGVAGLGYVLHKALYLALRLAGLDSGWAVDSEESISSALLGLSMASFVVGVSWPRLVNHRGVRLLAAHRAHRRLYPLWQDMCEATPSIALAPTRATDHPFGSRGRDVEARLYDRVIEIRDGVLALRPFATPELRDRARQATRAAGIPRQRLDAVADAAWLEAARRAKVRGEHPRHTAAGDTSSGGTDLAGEVRLLEQVARARRPASQIADIIAPAAGGGAGERP